MKPEKQQLIQDLLGDESRREATLLAGGRILRRRRHWRTATRGLALALVATTVVWSLEQKKSPPSVQASLPTVKPVASTQPRSLTDAELLALCPNTPVGLATLPDGKKLLLFPRPGDEKRFVTRL